MGKCKYCGKKAGFLSNLHKECEKLHIKGLKECKEFFEANLFTPFETTNKITDAIKSFKQNNFLTDDEIKRIILNEAQYNRANSIIEINKLRELTDTCYLPQNVLDENIEYYSQSAIKEKCEQFFDGKIELEDVFNSISTNKLNGTDLWETLIDSLNDASYRFLEDGDISNEEHRTFLKFLDEFNIDLGTLPPQSNNSNIIKVGQLILLKNLKNGIRPDISVDLPILLTKDEFCVWVYNQVSLFEEKTKSEWVGVPSTGVSVRICKGVYYHVGQTKKKKISTQYMAFISTGGLILTNKNMIFYSPSKSIKIPYKKIIALVPYSDGVEVQQQTNQKRLILTGFDAWFMMNLLSTVDI